jgi:hypothetical protein
MGESLWRKVLAHSSSWQKKARKSGPSSPTLTHPTPLQNPRTSFSKSSRHHFQNPLQTSSSKCYVKLSVLERSILQQVTRSTQNISPLHLSQTRTFQTTTRKIHHSASIAKPLTGLQVRFMTIATPLFPLTPTHLSMTRSTIFTQRWQ